MTSHDASSETPSVLSASGHTLAGEPVRIITGTYAGLVGTLEPRSHPGSVFARVLITTPDHPLTGTVVKTVDHNVTAVR